MTARSNFTPRGPLALCLSAAMGLIACGGTACPSPVFGEPVTVSWGTPTTGVNSVTPVVLRWTATNDPLPDRYYEPLLVGATRDGGAVPSTTARRTGVRELTLEMYALETYVRAHPQFAVTMTFPDTMGFVTCSHPGMADSYSVDVTFNFDVTAHTATARFSEVHVAVGACSVAAPGSPSSKGGALALVALAGVLSLRRRRDHRGVCGGEA